MVAEDRDIWYRPRTPEDPKRFRNAWRGRAQPPDWILVNGNLRCPNCSPPPDIKVSPNSRVKEVRAPESIPVGQLTLSSDGKTIVSRRANGGENHISGALLRCDEADITARVSQGLLERFNTDGTLQAPEPAPFDTHDIVYWDARTNHFAAVVFTPDRIEVGQSCWIPPTDNKNLVISPSGIWAGDRRLVQTDTPPARLYGCRWVTDEIVEWRHTW